MLHRITRPTARFVVCIAEINGYDIMRQTGQMMLSCGLLIRGLIRGDEGGRRPSSSASDPTLRLMVFFRSRVRLLAGPLILFAAAFEPCRADVPSPVLEDLFPLGVQVGTSVSVSVNGAHLEMISTLHLSEPRIVVEKTGDTTFRLTAPDDVPVGFYEVSAVGKYGISASRLFHVSRKSELIESDGDAAHTVLPLNSILSGRIEAGGEIDRFHFTAQAGDQIMIECWANRIESQLRAVLEIFDPHGRRLAVSRGEVHLDPRLDVRLPSDGEYELTVTDLTYTGGQQHFYRLSLGTGSRIDYVLPTVMQRDTTTSARLFGRNLVSRSDEIVGAKGAVEDVGLVAREHGSVSLTTNIGVVPGRFESKTDTNSHDYDWMKVDIQVPADLASLAAPTRLSSAQAAVEFLAYDIPGMDEPILISVTDVPVVEDSGRNNSPETALFLEFPCEVSGQLICGDEQDWFAFEARRGEVIWFEAFGERIGSPVDLDLLLLDHTAEHELCHMSDQLVNVGSAAFPTTHLDPGGRWVSPSDGRYLLLLRNLQVSLRDDPRRAYRLSLRREEQDFQVAVIPHRSSERTGLNVWRRGRIQADVVAFRSRGMTDPIRITAEDLPSGIECPDVWLGPGVTLAPLVITAGRDVPFEATALHLTAHAEIGTGEVVHAVRGGASGVSQSPVAAGRLTSEITLGIGPESPLLVTAQPLESNVSQGGLIELQVSVERKNSDHPSSTELTAVGLPPLLRNEISDIAAGDNQGWISFDLPAELQPGPYTFAVQAVTEIVLDDGNKTSVSAVSNPITITVAPAHFVLSIDPRTPKKIARGEIIQVNYAADRRNGFIGKIHTELTATGGLTGLRGRGVTFVGGTSSGVIQVIASDDAPLGPVRFLHLDALGTVEDKPIYRSGCFVDLEIVP